MCELEIWNKRLIFEYLLNRLKDFQCVALKFHDLLMKNSYAAEGSSMEKQFLSLAVASESSKGPMDEPKTSKNFDCFSPTFT